MKQLWVKKYAPTSFEHFIFANKQMRQAIGQLLEAGDIPHCLLTGAAGSGKSTAAKLLIDFNEIEPADVLTIDASVENGVDTVKDKIRSFVTTSGFGDIKVVLLEEFDKFSTAAQDTLRELMVRYSDDARFILTANHDHKITDAIKSRVQTYTFTSLPAASATKRACSILEDEGVDFALEDVERIVNEKLPDMRGVINTLQQYSINGKLKYTGAIANSNLLDLFLAGNFDGARDYLMLNIAPAEVIDVYGQLFENITQCELLTTNEDILDDAIILFAKYQYQHAFSADPIVCIAALFAELKKLTKNE
jgi:DNA polymerase III delta prime subunit